jgi:hypothetical protein
MGWSSSGRRQWSGVACSWHSPPVMPTRGPCCTKLWLGCLLKEDTKSSWRDIPVPAFSQFKDLKWLLQCTCHHLKGSWLLAIIGLMLTLSYLRRKLSQVCIPFHTPDITISIVDPMRYIKLILFHTPIFLAVNIMAMQSSMCWTFEFHLK